MVIGLFRIKIDIDRVYGLDILRALAIIFVMLGHSKAFLPIDYKPIANILSLDGVTIFFVLSGFLIGRILIKTFTQDKAVYQLINFWQRRWFRTLPNYFLILILLLVINELFKENFNSLNYKSFFFFSQNLFDEHPAFFDEAWSLSIEEWFYLIIPLMLYIAVNVLNINVNKSILYIAILILIVITFFRVYRFFEYRIYTFSEWDLLYRKQVITRIDSIMYGIIGAYIYIYHKKLWIRFKIPAFVAGLFILIITHYFLKTSFEYQNLFFCVFSFVLYSLGTLLLLPFLSGIKTGTGFLYRVLTIVSLISYSMYLLNFSLVKYWIIKQINWYSIIDNYYIVTLVKYLSFWIITIGLSILLYKYYEVPMTRLRESKFFKKK